MRYGVCIGCSSDNAFSAAKAGFDYTESNFGGIAGMTEDDFKSFEKAMLNVGIPCEAANCFMPSFLPPVGPNVKYDEIKEYVKRGMSRSEALGIKTVVFGSGGARRLPEGFSFSEGFKQLIYFVKEIASPIAMNHGISIAVEPLRRQETNIINSACEGVMLATIVDKPNVFGLVDLYHMLACGDTHESIMLLKDHIGHSHISNPFGNDKEGRIFPKNEAEYDYKGFVDALEKAGCGRCSIEASTDDFEKDAIAAAHLLKSL